VLEIAISRPSTLDPMRIGDPGSVLVARQLFEGLTRWDARRKRAVPAAARSWISSGRGRTFEFLLRRGMTFHDGTPVTARSFKLAFDRIARKKNASDIAYTLERVKGFVAVNERGTRDHLSGVEPVGRWRLRIMLTEPWREFPIVLTHPGLVPLPRRAIQKYGAFFSRPVGNGRYTMSRRWRGAGPIVLEAFEGAPRSPAVDRLRFVPFRDASVSWAPFVDGRIDVAEVPSDRLRAAAREYGTRGYKPLLAGLYLGLRTKSSSLARRELRVAISRAVDRRTIAQRIYGGTLAPPRGIVPRGVPGFGRDVCGRLCSYDHRATLPRLEGTRRARPLSIDIDRGRLQQHVARLIRRDLERIGLDVRIRTARLYQYLKRLGSGRVEMYRFGWIAEYPTPDAFLSALFEARSPDNHSGFASARVDALLRRARAEPLRRVRNRLYRRAEKLILRRVPVVPLGSFEMHWVAQPWVRHILFDAMGGFDAAGITIAAQ